MRNLDLSPSIRWSIIWLALLSGVVALRLGRMFFLPLAISLMIATVLWPAYQYLRHRIRLPRLVAGTIAITGLVFICCLATVWAIGSIQRLAQDLPQTATEQQAVYDAIRQRVEIISPGPIDQIMPPRYYDSVFFKDLDTFINDLARQTPGYLASALEQVLLILFMVLFLCVEGEMLISRTVRIFETDEEFESKAAFNALQDMGRQVRAYIVWRSVINIGMALFLGVVYSQLGLKQPWTWAILSGILTFVPYLGPVVAGLPPLADAFVGQGPVTALIILAIYVAVLLVEGYLIFPLVIGRNMEINATTVMVACLFWWVVWGEIGLFLALPLMAGVKAICQNVPDWQPWAALMSTESNPAGTGK